LLVSRQNVITLLKNRLDWDYELIFLTNKILGIRAMYAVVRTGGKQYKVTPGCALEIEKVEGSVGDVVELKEVLLVSNDSKINVGTPLVDGARVTCEIVQQTKGEKKIIFKKIRRHGKQLKKGHRQQLTRIRVK